MDSKPEPASPSVNSSRFDSKSNISVGGGSFRDGVGFEGAGTSPVPVVVRSRWLNAEGLLFPFPIRREDFVELDLLESGGREGSLPESKRSVGESEVRVSEVREGVQKIVP